jgi:hypothetical protein
MQMQQIKSTTFPKETAAGLLRFSVAILSAETANQIPTTICNATSNSLLIQIQSCQLKELMIVFPLTTETLPIPNESEG